MNSFLAHQIIGEGPVVVLLHGFCENQQMWRKIVPKLSRTHQVITVDLGGFNESSDLLPEPVNMQTLGQQVLDLLQHLKVSKAIIIGHSLGGYIALAMAEQQPQLFAGIGLVHSSAKGDSKSRKNSRNRVIEIVEKRGVATFANQFVPTLFLPSRHTELKEAILEAQEMALKTPHQSVIEVTKAMRDRSDRSQLLSELPCPILFLIGKQDQAITFNQYLPQIVLPQDACIHILDNTAHMGIWERPFKTQRILQNFVNYCAEHNS